MKNLSDFKKRIKVGTKLHTVYHQNSVGRDEHGNIILRDEDKGIREVSIVKSSQFALKTTHKDGLVVDSWLYYPRASEIKIIDENTIQVMCEEWRREEPNKLIPLLTYTFV